MDTRTDPLHVRAHMAARLAEAEAHRRTARLAPATSTRPRLAVSPVRLGRLVRRLATRGRTSATTSLAGRNPS